MAECTPNFRASYDAAETTPSHDDRFPLQLRIKQFFHGHEKGIHINVKDRPGKTSHRNRDNSATHFTKMETGAIVESVGWPFPANCRL
jgi:hypothetical protein